MSTNDTIESIEDSAIDTGQYDEDGIESSESEIESDAGASSATPVPVEGVQQTISSGRSNIIIFRPIPWFSA